MIIKATIEIKKMVVFRARSINELLGFISKSRDICAIENESVINTKSNCQTSSKSKLCQTVNKTSKNVTIEVTIPMTEKVFSFSSIRMTHLGSDLIVNVVFA